LPISETVIQLFLRQIFIWNGCGGSGRYAVQLACLAGYKVVTTADRLDREEAFLAGAAAVFDGFDPALISRVRMWARKEGGGPLRKALDPLSFPGTIKISMSLLEEGGELVTLCE
jgi:NADPH:quinone reductase-like Zn-dependent oxidoreductase